MIEGMISTYFLPLVVFGYLIYAIFRVVLSRRIRNEQVKIQKEMDERVTKLQTQLKQQSRDLQDSIQMINHEYSNLLRDMAKEEAVASEQLIKKIKELEQSKKQSNDASSNESPPTAS